MVNLSALLEKKSHFLFGPRQTVKTFLFRKTLKGVRVYDLLDFSIYLALSQNPGRIAQELTPQDRLVVIDEIQRLPVLLNEVHRLIEGRGVNSGLMVAQYTQAALISENKVLCHPAVVDSISVSADQEDHVNMGPVAVRKCKEIIKNVSTVIAVQLLAGAQALDFRKPKKPGKGVAAAYDLIRQRVPFMENDRALYPDIEQVGDLVRSRELLDAVEAAIGPLSLVPEG